MELCTDQIFLFEDSHPDSNKKRKDKNFIDYLNEQLMMRKREKKFVIIHDKISVCIT